MISIRRSLCVRTGGGVGMSLAVALCIAGPAPAAAGVVPDGPGVGQAVVAADASASAEANDIKPVEPFTKVLGKSLGDWAGVWTQWAYSFPSARSPFLDQTGEFCAFRQQGGVWFLAGSFFNDPVVPYRRVCTIPKGSYIFFPMFNAISFAPEFPEPEDPCSRYSKKVDQVRCDANRDVAPKAVDPIPAYWNAGAVVLKLEVDGQSLADPFAYQIQSDPGGFRFFVRKNSIVTEFGLAAGPRYPAVADGYWIMLPPLPVGDHTIRTFTEVETGNQMDVTWSIRIQ